MRLLNPWALGLLIFIPVIILMYILKQKFEEREVSSIYLWQQVLKDIEVNTPWQKLTKNLLLFLQLLAATALVFALANPLLNIGESYYESLIIVIDNTGSMNAKYEGTTRMEAVKKEAENLVKNANPAVAITVISSGTIPKVEINGTKDKNQALSVIRNIKSGNSIGNVGESLSIVKAIADGQKNSRIVFFTDNSFNITGINGEARIVSSKTQNVSIDRISHSKTAGGIKALIKVTNRGSKNITREVTLYGEEEVLDIRTVQLAPGETSNIYFEGIPENIRYLSAELSGHDDMEEDDAAYVVLNRTSVKKVLLISKSNIFIEKALSLMEGIELYKTNPGEDISGDYDLYVFDGFIPDSLPKKGNIIVINPDKSSEFGDVHEEVEGGRAETASHTLTKYIQEANFVVAKLKNIEKPYWADVIMKAGGKIAAYAGENKGRKVLVLAFDLHHSDFPLNPEYPIFMSSALQYLSDAGAGTESSYICGEAVHINPLPDAESARMETPTGKEEISLSYPILPFKNTAEPGVYKLVQKTADGEKESIFAVNFPAEEESRGEEQKRTIAFGQTTQAGSTQGSRSVQTAIIALLIGLIALEWMVYIHGY